MHKKIYLSPPHMSGREQDYISEAFRSNWIAPLGPLVNSFEEQLAERVGVKALPRSAQERRRFIWPCVCLR